MHLFIWVGYFLGRHSERDDVTASYQESSELQLSPTMTYQDGRESISVITDLCCKKLPLPQYFY